MAKVRLLLNIGWQDAEGLGLHDFTANDLAEGKVIDVDQTIADKLVNQMKLAVVDDGKQKMTAKRAMTAREKFGKVGEPTPEDDTEVVDEEVEASPVSDTAAAEAIDGISRMRSVEKLEAIVNTDPRATVVTAAQRRLEEINGTGEGEE